MPDTRWFNETLHVESSKKILPTPAVLDALKQDYPIEASIADLVDNSIDARASLVLVRLFRRAGRLLGMCVADNGRGMSESEIDRAMQFAGRRDYSASDLGMFGLGLKTASLSQSDSVTVLSRSRGHAAVGRRWTEAGIKHADWRCDVIAADDCASELRLRWGSLGVLGTGTLVRWDHVRDFDRLPVAEIPKYVGALRRAITNHVGLKLHRILASGKVRILLDELDVDTGEQGLESSIEPLNPFPDETGRRGYPRHFVIRVPEHGDLEVRAHIWPKKSTARGFKLETGKVAAHQGFYFFRHDRLVQDGDWNGVRAKAEPHLSLARVEIDIPDALATYFRVRSTKRGVDVPRSFTSAVESAFAKDDPEIGFRDYLAAAEEVYRTRGEQQERPVLKPGAGIPAAVRKALERESVPFRPGDGMTLKWGTIPGKDFFWFDRETDEVVLNERYRTALLSGRKASSADLPVLRALIFFLLAPTLERERDSVAESGRLRALQSALIAAAELERSK